MFVFCLRQKCGTLFAALPVVHLQSGKLCRLHLSLVCYRCSAVGVTVLGVSLYFEGLKTLGLCRCVELQLWVLQSWVAGTGNTLRGRAK